MLETEPKLIETYVDTGKVKLVFQHLIDFGEPSLRSSHAAECAGEQDAFWEMHATLYERQAEIWRSAELPATLAQFAADLGLDTQAFDSCMASDRYVEKIEADHAAAKAAGVTHRPSFRVNDSWIIGAQPFARFQAVIDQALASD